MLAGLTERPNLLVVIERGNEVAMKSVRNLQNVHVLVADQLNTYDVLCADDIVFTQAALDAFVAGPVKADAKADQGGREVSIHTKDPRDILIAPVVSEKSYGLLDEGKYTFLVDPRAEQDRDQDRHRADLQRQGRQGPHAEPPGQVAGVPVSASASARTPSVRSSPSARARSTSSVRAPETDEEQD